MSTDGGEAAPTGGPAAPTRAATEPAAARRAAVRKIDSPASEPVDLAGVAGPAVLKRLAPVVVGLLAAAVRPAPPALTAVPDPMVDDDRSGRRRERCSAASRSARSRSSSATTPARRS